MPRYTEDFSPFRALLGAPYPLPIYIARRVYPRQPANQRYTLQQPAQPAQPAQPVPTGSGPNPPPPPGPPPPIPIPPCPATPPTNDPVAAAAHAQGFPYDPAWRERPPATCPVPYPARTPEQEAQTAARNEIRLELRRYRRIAASGGRVYVNVVEGARDAVDAMAPVRNMQAVRRMQNMLNITAPHAARLPRSTSAPTTPARAQFSEQTCSQTSSGLLPVDDATAKGRRDTALLRSAAVIVPRQPDLSDLASYYPRADPFSDATADPEGGFRHWSDEGQGGCSPWNTPRRVRRGSGQSGASPSSSQSNQTFTPHTPFQNPAELNNSSSPRAVEDGLDVDSSLRGDRTSLATTADLQLTPAEASAVKAITALVHTQVEQTPSETIIRIPRSYHTRARMIAEQCGAAPNPIPPSPAAAAVPGSASAASIQAGGDTAVPRVRVGFDPDVNSYVAVYDDHTLLISPATHHRLREVLGLEADAAPTEPDEPLYSPMAIDPRTADAMGQSAYGLGGQHLQQPPARAASGSGTADGFASFGSFGSHPLGAAAALHSRPADTDLPDDPGHAGQAASWPRPLPARETGAFEPAPNAGMHLLPHSSAHDRDVGTASHSRLGADQQVVPGSLPRPLPPQIHQPPRMTASGLITRPAYTTGVNGLSRRLTPPPAPASRPPPFMPAAKACHNALLALRIAEWRKGAVMGHNYRLLGNALREGRRVQYAPEGEGWSAERVKGFLDGKREDEGFLGARSSGQCRASADLAAQSSPNKASSSMRGDSDPVSPATGQKRAREASPLAGAPVPSGASAPRPIGEVMRAIPAQSGSDADVRPALKRLRPRKRR